MESEVIQEPLTYVPYEESSLLINCLEKAK